jgi:protoheme IX farnesyltransferase
MTAPPTEQAISPRIPPAPDVTAAVVTPGTLDAVTGVPVAAAYMRDLLSLTKPRIISLLLVTTVTPMFVAGNPDWLTVVIVLVGGYLMAGGANAVNMYFDRDIDLHMARTRLRPIPSGRMAAPAVLAFGVALAAAATGLLAHFVNLLTAGLAVAGFYFYVLVYTRWLKRSTPQNIVIGGAAGAVPPLVGWAAVTGRVDLLAVYLFLIIFYWTPPHFWALALLKQRDYGRAGVPMAPLIWGERRTIDQMVWYTAILCALSLVPLAFGAFGPIYLAVALVLDGMFVARMLRVRRSADWAAPAWSLYKFSLLYLALLFAAMAVDRQITMHVDVPWGYMHLHSPGTAL